MTSEQLVEKWSGILKYAKWVPTWTEPATLAYLCELASKSQFAIECGTYMGASLIHMLLSGNCHIWAIDQFEVFGTKQITEKVCESFIEKGQCEIIQGNSARGGEMLRHMGGRIDFAWIDDGHAEEDLRRDISSFLPLLKPGGLLVGHDWDGDNDVARGVKSMLPLDKITFPTPRCWQYIKP